MVGLVGAFCQVASPHYLDTAISLIEWPFTNHEATAVGVSLTGHDFVITHHLEGTGRELLPGSIHEGLRWKCVGKQRTHIKPICTIDASAIMCEPRIWWKERSIECLRCGGIPHFVVGWLQNDRPHADGASREIMQCT